MGSRKSFNLLSSSESHNSPHLFRRDDEALEKDAAGLRSLMVRRKVLWRKHDNNKTEMVRHFSFPQSSAKSQVELRAFNWLFSSSSAPAIGHHLSRSGIVRRSSRSCYLSDKFSLWFVNMSAIDIESTAHVIKHSW